MADMQVQHEDTQDTPTAAAVKPTLQDDVES